jgi:hypothetical protein
VVAGLTAGVEPPVTVGCVVVGVVTVVESGETGNCVVLAGFVIVVPIDGLATTCVLADGEQAETNQTTEVTTASPHPTIKSFNLDIFHLPTSI